MADLAVRFEDAEEETFYKILAALASMKGEGVGKVRLEEKKVKGRFDSGWDIGWFGEVQFLSKEALEIFGKKLKRRPRSSSV